MTLHYRRFLPFFLLFIVTLLFLLFPALAHASATGGAGLPWENPLQTLTNSIKGPVAFAISLMGLVVCGAMLIWGGEINEFVLRSVMMVLVISLLVFAANILQSLFSAGAVITP